MDLPDCIKLQCSAEQKWGIKLIALKAYPSRDNSAKKKRPDYWAWKSGDKVLETALRKHQHATSVDKVKQRHKLKSMQ